MLSWIFDTFILDRIEPELRSLKSLELKFGLSSDFSELFCDRTPVRIHLDVLFRVFRFSRASFNAVTSSFPVLKLCPLLGTETYETLPWQFCNFTCEITN